MKSSINKISNTTELGSFLKASRESKDISLEQIHSITNIRIKYLVAIEVGDLSQIPGGEVYIRGFLRSYARAIDQDANEILNIYKGIQGDTPNNKELAAISVVDKRDMKKPRISIKPRTVILISIVLLVSILGLSVLKNSSKSAPAPPQNNVESVPPVVDGDVLPDDEKKPAETDQSLAEEVDMVLIVLAEADASRSVYLIDDNDLVVSLEVLEDRCWISSSLDGTLDFEGTLSRGAIQTFTAGTNITIRIGNPEVVKLIVNNKDLGVPGGSARNFVFERSN